MRIQPSRTSLTVIMDKWLPIIQFVANGHQGPRFDGILLDIWKLGEMLPRLGQITVKSYYSLTVGDSFADTKRA